MKKNTLLLKFRAVNRLDPTSRSGMVYAKSEEHEKRIKELERYYQSKEIWPLVLESSGQRLETNKNWLSRQKKIKNPR